MTSRRTFMKSLGAGLSAGWIGGRGREALGATSSLAPKGILLSSNENPLGPSQVVLDRVRSSLRRDGDRAGRYPFAEFFQMPGAIGKSHGVAKESVFIGCGSTQVLRTATDLFTSESRPLVSPAPTYEVPKRHAEALERPVRETPLDGSLRIDLDALASASRGAGLVYLCNPNNPTGTVHLAADVRAFIEKVVATSPDTTVLVDEAYFDYVSVPDHQSLLSLAVENPRVLVTRTFSKAYGMAGLRIGYVVAHPETIQKLAAWEGFELYTNFPALSAAEAALAQGSAFLETERARNAGVRELTRDYFANLGFSVADSQANFVFVDLKRPSEEFRTACSREGVVVGRPFPPLESHVRISLGTIDEMKRALQVFSKVLAREEKAAG